MLQPGTAIKVTVYLNRDTDTNQGFLADEILQFLKNRDIEGATVVQAHAGFGAHHQLHVEGAGDVRGLHLPILVTFIASQQQFASVRDELLTMVTDGLVEAHLTEVLRHVSKTPRVVA